MRAHRGERLERVEHHRLAGEREVLLRHRIPDARALPGGGHESEDFRHDVSGRSAIVNCAPCWCGDSSRSSRASPPAATSGRNPSARSSSPASWSILTVNGPATYFEDAEGHALGFRARPRDALREGARREAALRARRQRREGRARDPRAARRTSPPRRLVRHLDLPGGIAWGPSYFTAQHQIVVRAARPEAEGPRRHRRQARGRGRGVVCGLAALRAAQAHRAHRAPAAGHADRRSCCSRSPTASSTTRWSNRRASRSRASTSRSSTSRSTSASPCDYAWLVVARWTRSASLDAAKPFFERIAKDGTLKRLVDRYYGHAARITRDRRGDAARAHQHACCRRFKPYFIEAEQRERRRLAPASPPIGYQESHWDPKATSPTGVRGLMMLTEETAQRLQVKDRLDARESILGGARYLVLMRDALPPRIAGARPHLPRARRLQPRASATSRTRASSRSAPGSIPTSGRTCAR